MHGSFYSGHVDNSFTTKIAMGSVETGTAECLKTMRFNYHMSLHNFSMVSKHRVLVQARDLNSRLPR
jgi:hypothetical protein